MKKKGAKGLRFDEDVIIVCDESRKSGCITKKAAFSLSKLKAAVPDR